MNSECPICKTLIINKPSIWKKLKGLSTCSRKCRGEYLRSYYRGNKNPNSKYQTNIAKFFGYKTLEIRSSAKKRKLECNITDNFLELLFNKQNGLCYYTSVPLKLVSNKETFKGLNQPDLDVLSVDRINSSLGYLENNVVLACNAVNKMKGSSSEIDFKNFLNFTNLQKSGCLLQVKKLTSDALLPQKNKLGDVGYDLFVHKVEDCGTYIKVYSGISIQPTIGFYLQMYPRSSIYKRNLFLANSVGICDNLYTGEYMGIFYKTKDYDPEKDIFIKGERFAQVVVAKYELVEIEEVNSLWEGGRGSLGFGSSGA